MKIRVGVLFGGPTTEHEVSVITAVQAIEYIDKEKYDIVPIYIDKNREWYTGTDLLNIDNYKDMNLLISGLSNVVLYKRNNEFVLQRKKGLFKNVINKVDIVMPIVHGFNMEDGTIEGYLEMIGVPYTGSDIFGCVVGQDKVFQKQIVESAKIPILPYEWFYDSEYQEDEKKIITKLERIGYPLIVKPARLGSSIGIAVAKNKEELVKAIEDAILYDEKIVVEKALTDYVELNCSILGNSEIATPSVIEEVMGKDEILSFNDKYFGSGKTKGKIQGSKGMASTDRVIPARIDDKTASKIEKYSINAFKALSASGVVRIDYLMDKKTKDIYLNELNTIPGCLAFYLWTVKDKSYTELLNDIIELGIKRYKKKEKKTFSFDTNLLSDFSSLVGTKGVKGMKGSKFKN